MSLRAMPNLAVMRPADANETAEAWRWAMTHRDGPVAIVLTRQKLPVLDRRRAGAGAGLARGAYVLADADRQARRRPSSSPPAPRCTSRSRRASCSPKSGIRGARGVDAVLGALRGAERRVSRVGAAAGGDGARLGRGRRHLRLARWIGDAGIAIGIDRFGASAPGEVNMEKFGFTAEHVARAVRSLVR